MVTNNYATLSNDVFFSVFKYGGIEVRFKSPYSLEKYTEIKSWNNGYIVVMAKYNHNETAEEEYIDLDPILEDLYIDSKTFLKPIKYVKVEE